MDRLPEGSLIGRMQAPLQWVFSHTSRFAGAVRISMQDGEGFLLVQKGEPVAAYFEHPLKSLSGQPALKYFGVQPILDFGLRKYEPGEMEEALALSGELQALLQPDRELRAAGAVGDGGEKTRETPPGETPEPEPEPLRAVLEHPGVTAVACFSGGNCISSIGNIDADYVVAFAEDLLRWSLTLPKAMPACGSFVQMTLFYRDGNVIIAPYGDECLCIFTTPGVQFGQIRRLIREIRDGM